MPLTALVTALVPAALMLLGVVGAEPTVPRSTLDDVQTLPEGAAVLLTGEGYVVSLREGAAVTRIELPCGASGCAADPLHPSALVQALSAIKVASPTIELVTLYPHGDVPYRMVHQAMEAARQPRVTAAGEDERPLYPLAIVSSRFE